MNTMKFSIDSALGILKNTPDVLLALMNNLSSQWSNANEGENSWTIKEVIAHLIICEETNWLPRAKIILSEQKDKLFIPIDMVAHFEMAQNNSVDSLINNFKKVRKTCILEIEEFNLQEADLLKTAIHPSIGQISLKNLLSTWVAHDLSHLAQISRVMAKQYKIEIGPYIQYLTRLN